MLFTIGKAKLPVRWRSGYTFAGNRGVQNSVEKISTAALAIAAFIQRPGSTKRLGIVSDMGNPNYELLEDWHAYCQDEAEFPEGHFDTLLMELLYDFGDSERLFIESVCQHFTNGKRLAQLLCKAGTGVKGLTDRQIKGRLIKHATGDIRQKLPLLKMEKQARLANKIAKLPISATDYPSLLAAKEESELQEEFELHVSNAIATNTEYDPWQAELSNAVYYGFANDLRFQQIFDTYMLDALEPLSEDFELWRMGGEYVITDSEILVSKIEPTEDGLVWSDDYS